MKEIIKECKTHGQTVYKLRANGHGHIYRCAKCTTEAVQRRRLKVKQLSIDYKGGKCCMCGYNKCNSALEFHHLDPNEKDFGISAKGVTRSFEKIKVELDKCILVCANCHRELHEEQDNKE